MLTTEIMGALNITLSWDTSPGRRGIQEYDPRFLALPCVSRVMDQLFFSVLEIQQAVGDDR